METELFINIIDEERRKEREKEKTRQERETQRLFLLFTVDTEHEEHAAVCAEQAGSSKRQHPAAPGPRHSSHSVQMRKPIAWA